MITYPSESPENSGDRFEKLSQNHNLRGFKSVDHSMNWWLRKHALSNQEELSNSVTHVLTPDGSVVKGFITLTNSSLGKDLAPDPTHVVNDEIPVILIARLGVHKTYGGQGIGKMLLNYGFKTILTVADVVGVGYALIDATESSKSWYVKLGLNGYLLPQNDMRFAIPVKDLRKMGSR